MENFFQYAADIIRAAAASPLGILALLILIVAVLAFFFFKDAPIWVRFSIFAMIFVATCGFGGVVLQRTQVFAANKAQAAGQKAALQTLLLTATKPPVTVLPPQPPNNGKGTNIVAGVTTSSSKSGNDASWAEARSNIKWVFEDAGAKRTYEMAVSQGLSKYQAVLAAQGHNSPAQKTVAAIGEVQTEKFIDSLGH